MAEDGSEGVLCRYFLSGKCRDGHRCPFFHGSSMGMADNVCRYYLKGECVFDRRCKFDHIGTKPRTDGGGRSRHNRRSQNDPGSAEGDNQSRNHAATSGSSSNPSRAPLKCGAERAQKSYASIVRPEGGDEKAPPSKDASLPLCPYELACCNCPVGDRCSYVHGQLCDLCQKPCLPPFNEDQRVQHREKCVQRHEQDMESSNAVQQTAGKSCAICMDIVMNKEPASERRFGILEKCSHVFCLNCIRTWRGSKRFGSETVRACPACRTPSDFVTPSNFWVDMGAEKDKLLADYKSAMSQKPCRYFQKGRGKCQFAGACFYKHMYPDGSKAVMSPPPPRRRQNNDELAIMQRLSLLYSDDVAESQAFEPFNLYEDDDEEEEEEE